MSSQLNMLKTLHSELITNTAFAKEKLLWIANKKKEKRGLEREAHVELGEGPKRLMNL